MGENIFRIIAAVLIAAAAYFLWHGNTDGVFISAVLGSVAFFLSIRFQAKRRNDAREAVATEKQETEAGPESAEEPVEIASESRKHHSQS